MSDLFPVPLHPEKQLKIKNMISAATRTLQANNKTIYVALLSVLTFFLFLDYIPGLEAWSAWVTPPVALFLGLIFALACGQAHPKFNKKTSKYLLQYSVVGLGFGMNLHSALASGKEGNGIYGYFGGRHVGDWLVYRPQVV